MLPLSEQSCTESARAVVTQFLTAWDVAAAAAFAVLCDSAQPSPTVDAWAAMETRAEAMACWSVDNEQMAVADESPLTAAATELAMALATA